MKKLLWSDMFIDGALFATLAWFIYNQAYFGGDEAAKYMNPTFKFWFNWGIGSIATLAGAIKTFRSQGYARHVEEKAEEKEEKKRQTAPPFKPSDL